MLDAFCQQDQLVNSPDIYALFLLTKLISSMIHSDGDGDDENDDDDDDDNEDNSQTLFEVAIAIAGVVSQCISPDIMQQMLIVGSARPKALASRLLGFSALTDIADWPTWMCKPGTEGPVVRSRQIFKVSIVKGLISCGQIMQLDSGHYFHI
jgi:hypothetical protein